MGVGWVFMIVCVRAILQHNLPNAFANSKAVVYITAAIY